MPRSVVVMRAVVVGTPHQPKRKCPVMANGSLCPNAWGKFVCSEILLLVPVVLTDQVNLNEPTTAGPSFSTWIVTETRPPGAGCGGRKRTLTMPRSAVAGSVIALVGVSVAPAIVAGGVGVADPAVRSNITLITTTKIASTVIPIP